MSTVEENVSNSLVPVRSGETNKRPSCDRSKGRGESGATLRILNYFKHLLNKVVDFFLILKKDTVC